MNATTRDVLGFRIRTQQLDRPAGTTPGAAVLDLGAQDTGVDGGRWALANRGLAPGESELATAWTLRGAPHLYRRADLPGVVAATAPFSEADAAKRIFDAAKPLKAAGIGAVAALDTIADAMRSIVTDPMVKGEVSARLTELMPEPYLRWCRPCQATHLYEQPFRLAALRAGLELRPGTSPPVLQPVPGLVAADTVPERLDVVRGCLRLLGPSTPKLVAGFLDAPVADVQRHWPDDVAEVTVEGQTRWVLTVDADTLAADPPSVTRLLGPFDLVLQARDRDLLVPDPARAKALWPVLGRPGAVLTDGALVGTWRPRKAGASLSLAVEHWGDPSPTLRSAIGEQAERLATFRGVRLRAVEHV